MNAPAAGAARPLNPVSLIIAWLAGWFGYSWVKKTFGRGAALAVGAVLLAFLVAEVCYQFAKRNEPDL